MPAGIANADSEPAAAESADRLNRLAATLAHEFAAPIGLLDPINAIWRMRMGMRSDRFPAAETVVAAALGGQADEESQAILWQPSRETPVVWLLLRIMLTETEQVVAAIGFASTPECGCAGEWGPPCPAPALRAWGESVVSRVTASAGGTDGFFRSSTADGPSLLDHLASRLRVSDPPERFQRLATSKLRAALEMEAIAWVPSHAQEPTVSAGALHPDVSSEELREWASAGRERFQSHDPTPGTPQGSIRQALAVMAAHTDAPAGWLIALNPRRDASFSDAQTRLLRSVASLISTQRSNARLYRELNDMLFGVIHALTAAIDAKDPYTSGHSERVARIAVQLGAALGLSTAQRGDLYLMGLLHDVGKIGIEDEVLNKRGPLTSEEYQQIQSHVRIGVHILSDLTKLRHILPGVRHHHERFDGSGYPVGLAGDAIPFEARILAVADAFDAMSNSRPYRSRLAPREIAETLRKGCGDQWDPRVVRALFTCRREVEQIQQKGLGESLNQAVEVTIRRPT